jgi:hypothetical protein
VTVLAIYDTETNGLLEPKVEKGGVTPPMDRMHTITIILQEGTEPPSHQRGRPAGYEKGSTGRGWERMGLVDALRILEQADVRVAFNGQDFDEGVNGKLDPVLGAIPLVYPWFTPKPGSKLIDPLLLSRLIYPDIGKSGPNNHRLPPFLKGKHSLKAWGLRLGIHKGDYNGGWAQWSEEMQDYGSRTRWSSKRCSSGSWPRSPPPRPGIEHEFAAIIRRQERRGFGFDEPKAITLLGELRERQQAWRRPDRGLRGVVGIRQGRQLRRPDPRDHGRGG